MVGMVVVVTSGGVVFVVVVGVGGGGTAVPVFTAPDPYRWLLRLSLWFVSLPV